MVGVGGSEGKWKGDLGDGNKDGREGAIVGGGGGSKQRQASWDP